MDIAKLVARQRDFFKTGQTKDLDFRTGQLKRLREGILAYEDRIYQALEADLGKSSFESYMTEVGLVIKEVNTAIKLLAKWAKRERVRGSLLTFPSKSYIYREPYGLVLIMSPWNYPFQLNLVPLIGAMAAGNCIILKTSEYASHTAHLLQDLVEEYFDPSYIALVQGGKEENTAVLQESFDYIFFTGSVHVGRVVMEAASKNLTPLTLELGGKSPALVDASADIDLAAKRISWGKFINAGQTCIAPDYVLVQDWLRDELLERIVYYIEDFYGPNPLKNETYPKIINLKHFNRLSDLMAEGDLAYGGQVDQDLMKIGPAIITEPRPGSDLMEEEIFGPILPLLAYKDLDEAMDLIKSKPRPLALYLFTEDGAVEDRIIEEISFGGGCINDSLMHFSNSNLPFGGVGQSGFGAYHGRHSFETFSHKKAILKKSKFLDFDLRYPPYTDAKLNILKRILK